jgi:cation diffusion facilitator CzcD-associated flavoprotein CzcO
MSVWLDRTLLSSQTDAVTIETDTPQQWDVAIVGAGPVGLLLAGELAAKDVRVVVFERDDAPSPIPKDPDASLTNRVHAIHVTTKAIGDHQY